MLGLLNMASLDPPRASALRCLLIQAACNNEVMHRRCQRAKHRKF